MIRELMQYDFLSKCMQQVATLLRQPDAILKSSDATVKGQVKSKQVNQTDFAHALIHFNDSQSEGKKLTRSDDGKWKDRHSASRRVEQRHRSQRLIAN